MKTTALLFILVCLTLSCASGPPAPPTEGAFSFEEVESSLVVASAPVFLGAEDGVRLAVYPYLADHPRATLVFVHGGGAYSGAGYPALAAGLAKNWGVNTYLLDLRGHGNSEGPRGDSPTVEQVYRDLRRVIGLVQRDNPALPLFLGGHSSGAGVVLNYLTWKPDDRVKGYLFVSPFFGYKAHTEKQEVADQKAVPSFSRVDVGPFVVNSMSLGLLGGHTCAVRFNYPDRILKTQPLLIPSITVNMALASTPSDPVAQWRALDHPFALFIGAEDEVMDATKVVAFAGLPRPEIRAASQALVVEKANHLSILLKAADLIGPAVDNLLR